MNLDPYRKLEKSMSSTEKFWRHILRMSGNPSMFQGPNSTILFLSPSQANLNKNMFSLRSAICTLLEVLHAFNMMALITFLLMTLSDKGFPTKPVLTSSSVAFSLAFYFIVLPVHLSLFVIVSTRSICLSMGLGVKWLKEGPQDHLQKTKSIE